MSILNEMYRGGIYPAEKAGYKENEATQTNKELTVKLNLLRDRLDGDSKVLLNEIEDAFGKLCFYIEEEGFVCGFRMDAQMMSEMLKPL